jgi:hypothetical protein
MRLSPSTRRLLEIDLQNAYHQHGLRSIAALAAHVKRSRSFVYNYVRDNPSLFPDLAINQRRPSPVAHPAQPLTLSLHSSPPHPLFQAPYHKTFLSTVPLFSLANQRPTPP